MVQATAPNKHRPRPAALRADELSGQRPSSPRAGVELERRRFFETGSLPQQVRRDIATSWWRCSEWGVLPDSAGKYAGLGTAPTRLAKASQPVISALLEDLGELPAAVIVTDADARVLLSCTAERRLGRSLERRNVLPGFVFAEEIVGTNGLGTPLETGEPVQVSGHEHFVEGLLDFVCVGVPIRDPASRRIVGVADVTCGADGNPTIVRALARQTARAIEQELAAGRWRADRALLDGYLEATSRTRDGVIAIGEQTVVANIAAVRRFTSGGAADGGVPLTELLDVAAASPGSGSPSGMRRVRDVIHLDNVRVGAVVTLPEPGGPTGMAGSGRDTALAGPGATVAAPEGVVGTHPSFIEALDAVLSSQHPFVALTGEAGVGKLTLARAAAEHDGRRTEILDAARRGLDLSAIADQHTAASDLTVIIRHADSLSHGDAATLGSFVQCMSEKGARVCATFNEAGGLGPESIPGVNAHEIPIPPLRDRCSDVPALVAHLLPDRTACPETLALLQRMVWPGNVHQLAGVLKHMAAQVDGPTALGVETVPLNVRSLSPRRPLGRLERAELKTILDALAETRSRKDAAAVLGLSRSTLYRRLRTYGIDPDNALVRFSGLEH